jgi:hypothetical protein
VTRWFYLSRCRLPTLMAVLLPWHRTGGQNAVDHGISQLAASCSFQRLMTALASARAAAATYRLALMVMSSPRVPARGTTHVIETRVPGRICCAVETELRRPSMTPGPRLAIVEG